MTDGSDDWARWVAGLAESISSWRMLIDMIVMSIVTVIIMYM